MQGGIYLYIPKKNWEGPIMSNLFSKFLGGVQTQASCTSTFPVTKCYSNAYCNPNHSIGDMYKVYYDSSTRAYCSKMYVGCCDAP